MPKTTDCKKCEYCQRGLVPLKRRVDWETRRFHKKCWFLYLMLEDLKAEIARDKITAEEKAKKLLILDQDIEGLHRTTF